MTHLFAPGLPWPASRLGPEGYISADLDGETFTLLVGYEVRVVSPALRTALEGGRYSAGFTVDPPNLSFVVFDEFMLASQRIAVDLEEGKRIATRVRTAKTRRLVIATVTNGFITRLVEKPSKASFWKIFGRKVQNPQRDSDLEDEAPNMIWPPMRDVRPVYCIDGNWHLMGWRL